MKITFHKGSKVDAASGRLSVRTSSPATIEHCYTGVGIKTDQGLFGVAQRDGGIEVMLEGHTVWTSTTGAADGRDAELQRPKLMGKANPTLLARLKSVMSEDDGPPPSARWQYIQCQLLAVHKLELLYVAARRLLASLPKCRCGKPAMWRRSKWGSPPYPITCNAPEYCDECVQSVNKEYFAEIDAAVHMRELTDECVNCSSELLPYADC